MYPYRPATDARVGRIVSPVPRSRVAGGIPPAAGGTRSRGTIFLGTPSSQLSSELPQDRMIGAIDDAVLKCNLQHLVEGIGWPLWLREFTRCARHVITTCRHVRCKSNPSRFG